MVLKIEHSWSERSLKTRNNYKTLVIFHTEAAAKRQLKAPGWGKGGGVNRLCLRAETIIMARISYVHITQGYAYRTCAAGVSTAIKGHKLWAPLDGERAGASPHPSAVVFSYVLRCVSSWLFEHHQPRHLTDQLWPALGLMRGSSQRNCDGEDYFRTAGSHST